MKKLFTHIPLLCIALLASLAGNAQIVINELMQSNIDCIKDNLNDFPDSWIEFYNAGSSTENLNGYKLSITRDIKDAWTMPKGEIPAGQFLLIYCDKETGNTHTPFRLESGDGCSVYLFKNGVLVDSIVNLPKQPAPNIAYGKLNETSDRWGYQATPTPRKANCGKLVAEILGDPIFSETGRIITTGEEIDLTLSMPENTPQGTLIRYTLNGKEPTEESTQYTEAIHINKTTLVRAKLFCEGYMSPRSQTHSFIYHNRTQTLPIISLVTNNDYFWGEEDGILKDGIIEWTNSGELKFPNYYYSWRRPVNIEYFETDGTPAEINQLGETRILGQSSRVYSLKSLVIYANKRFGKKNFKYEMFPEQRPGVKKFKSLILRNAGNDFTELYMRDAIIQSTMANNKDIDFQAYRPAVVYLNGEYYGMLNIRERSNGTNVETNYEGMKDYDLIEGWGREIKEGDSVQWLKFVDFYTGKTHTMEEYAERIDIDEFSNIMAMNLYFNNYDFPGNNCVWWRPRTEEGKWRIIAKDCDFGMGLNGIEPTFPILEWFHNPGYTLINGIELNAFGSNEDEFTELFYRMMNNMQYRRFFLDRIAVYMGDFLNAKGVHEVWDKMYEAVSEEIPYHQEALEKWWDRVDYPTAMAFANDWIDKRTDFFYNHIAQFYTQTTPLPLTVNKQLSEAEQLACIYSINNTPLTRGLFDGKFYSKMTVTLSSEPIEAEVSAWQIKTTDSKGKTEEKQIDGSECSFVIPDGGSVEANAILADYDNIYDVTNSHRTSSDIKAAYDLQGRQIATDSNQRGIRIVKNSDGTTRKILFR